MVKERSDGTQKKAQVITKVKGTRRPAKPVKVGRKSQVVDSFPVVGVGASAGGLEALQILFTNMPVDTGFAFVVVTHTDPSHESMMPELLRRCASIPVFLAEDEMTVQPNTVYVIPHDKDISIRGGSLRLTNPVEPRGIRFPVDFFLRSLARDCGSMAICVILSGTGTDGTLGLKAIKSETGTVIVQDPKSAKYDGMPKSALDTGLADFVLQLSDMPTKLKELARRIPRAPDRPHAQVIEQFSDALPKILTVLRSHTKHDFFPYKPATLARRIERRMMIHGIENPADYVSLLEEHSVESHALVKDILINVTGFFRDPEAFSSLGEQVRRQLSFKFPGDSYRVWIPGCASGEEAYSVALVVTQAMDALKLALELQIFATDVDPDAIAVGRRGIYPASVSAGMSPEHVNQLFFKRNGDYVIKKPIRDTLVFAPHNVIKDPPFSSMDLICCRNLLIYLDNEAQKSLLSVFHRSLNSHGILFLGPSETIREFSPLFSPLDKKWRIFERHDTLELQEMKIPLRNINTPGETFTRAGEGINSSQIINHVSRLAERVLVSDYAPPCAVIDKKQQVVYVHGQISKYLELPDGQVNLDIVNMAKGDLRTELAAAIQTVATENRQVDVTNISVQSLAGPCTLNLAVKPFSEPASSLQLIMVTFQEVTSSNPVDQRSVKDRQTHRRSRIVELERELDLTRRSLQTTIEQLEVSNEELRSTNEELQSTNEEMQSTNEELETSREELQSMNEELLTVNAEHQVKIEDLSTANNDIANFLDSTDIATVFLDSSFRIRLYTSPTTKILNIIDSDIGRSISHVTTNLIGDISLIQDAENVLKTHIPHEGEVQTKDEQYFLMRILPYHTAEGVIDGVVLTFVDINEQKKAGVAVLELAQGIVNTVREPLLVLNSDLRVISANTSFYRFFQVREDDTVGRFIYDLGNNQWDIPRLRELLEKVLPSNKVFDDYRVGNIFPTIGHKVMLLNGRMIKPGNVDSPMILLAIEDITAREERKAKQNSKPHDR